MKFGLSIAINHLHRAHEYNTSFLLMTFLPYHTLPMFTTLLSILPENIPHEYRFLQPYIRSLVQPPRSVFVQAAINNIPFASTHNAYVLHICKLQQHYPAVISFWFSVMTEATAGMMDKARSGRMGVQQQNEQDVILRLLPTLNQGLAMKKVPDLRIGCYMILSVMAGKGALEDKLLNAMMEALVLGWTPETTNPGLVCLSILTQHRSAKLMPKRVTKEVLKVPNLHHQLVELSKQYGMDKFISSLCLALVDRLQSRGDIIGLPIIQHAIENHVMKDSQSKEVITALVMAADQLDDSTETQRIAKPHVASALLSLSQLTGNLGTLVRGALNDTEVDMDQLELKLHTTIRPATTIEQPSEDTIMEESDTEGKELNPSFRTLLEQLPKRTVNESSFLTHDSSHIYSDLCGAFLVAVAHKENIVSFDAAPILRRESAFEDALYLTFYMKTWCGPYPVIARASALQMATQRLSKSPRSSIDFQAVLPYAIVGLTDASSKVRRAAAELLLVISQTYPSGTDSKKKLKQMRPWPLKGLYGANEISELSADAAAHFVTDLLLPALEECVLDSKHIEAVFQKSLNGSKGSETIKKQEFVRLSKTTRTSISLFLASHVIHTPLYAVKLRLLNCLNQVRSVGDLTRTKVLLPVLRQWTSLDGTRAGKYCQDERVDLAEYNDQALLIVTPNDAEGLQILTGILTGELAADRQAMMNAAYKRLRAIWPALKVDLSLSLAETLLNVAQVEETTAGNEAASAASANFLRTTPLSSDILSLFLDQLPTAAKLTDKPPATKRRRTSHGEIARTAIQNPKQLTAAINKVTFVLQLVESSTPGDHPGLLRGLFNALAELQHFKAQVSSELAYLQNLVLGSLLAIMNAYRSNATIKLDRSAVRADLLVDCVQKTSSPQVQNAALLLISALAHTAPELVLHSVMPIFTFMGSSVLRQNDEYSAHVISQTIHEVIPPLISSLRKDKGNPVTGAAELLLSFVAAYEHVPMHRRKGLFTSLIQTLGPEDFMFALLAMLVDKYGPTEKMRSFAAELLGSFGVEIQLLSAIKYLELVGDILKPKPTFSTILLSANEDKELDPYEKALNELSLLPHILSQKRLVSKTGKLLDHDDMDAARIRELYSQLLENILAMADTTKNQPLLHSACGDVLESLLGLLSTSEFIKSVESLLDRPNESLRRKILRSLEVRIDQESPSNAVSRAAMLSFMPQLTAIIRESNDVLYKHTAVSCVDKISEKYGKKDIEAVLAAAETIASAHCLGQSDDRLRVMALLCLASLVDILREGIVSVLPAAIPKALEYMEMNSYTDVEAQKLYNAGYAFFSALVQYVPYMVTGGYLSKILEISSASAQADVDDGNDSEQSRSQFLHLAAKQIDAKSMFEALERNWDVVSTTGPKVVDPPRLSSPSLTIVQALRQYLEVLGTTIDKHPKHVVTKYSSILAKIFQKTFDLRRQWNIASDERLPVDDVYGLELVINDVAIKMIYKFNDATFRPIFSNLIEWTSSLPKKDKSGKALRRESIYGFMEVFFDNLKSIVTNYATYLIEDTVEVLKNVDSEDDVSKEVWARVLRTLKKCFEHDQDDFWQTPSHFGAIAPVLCAQFTHASNLPLTSDLLPTIVELAAAADSQENHKELNTAILKHLRSPNASVRLAAVRCEQDLTDRLGEEWMSMLPEMLPFISELQEDDDDVVEKETHRWIVKIEDVLGESLDSMLQ